MELNDNYSPVFQTTEKTKFHFGVSFERIRNVKDTLITQADRIFKQVPKSKHQDIFKLLKFIDSTPRIKIVDSDKNLGLIAMDLVKYDKLVMTHLSNQNTYMTEGKLLPIKKFIIAYNRTWKAFLNIRDFTTTLCDNNSLTINFDAQIIKYLKNFHFDSFDFPKFHVLPKLHKGTENLQSRPIVGAINWMTTPISKILAKLLQPLISDPCILKNSHAMLDQLQHYTYDTNEKPILVTMDISSLYTNIKNDKMCNILRDINPTLATLFTFIIEHNYFTYNNHIYKQKDGIAMGTNCAPELANLYLKKTLDVYMKKILNIDLYKRYLDDIFFIWWDTEEKLTNFLEIVNHEFEGIKFTSNYSYKSIEFLDLNLKLEPGQPRGSISFCTHQKKLNKYGYITPLSMHPRHTLSGFIKGELTRYARNSSRESLYLATKNLFYQRLRARHYASKYLTPIFKDHKYDVRYLAAKPRNIDHDLVSFSFRYSNRPSLKQFRKHTEEKALENMKGALPKLKIQPSWRTSPSIRNLLLKSELTEKQSKFLFALNPSRWDNSQPSDSRKRKITPVPVKRGTVKRIKNNETFRLI